MTQRSKKPKKKAGRRPKEDTAKAGERLERAKQQLQEAERCWEDHRFVEALKQKPPEEKQRAFDLKVEIGTRILEIENAQIKLVAGKVEKNSKELESAIEGLGEALETLSNVTRILNATGSLLSIVGRVLALV